MMKIYLPILYSLFSFARICSAALANAELAMRASASLLPFSLSSYSNEDATLSDMEDVHEWQRLLLPSSSSLGCASDPLELPSFFANSNEKFVLLLERGKCTYEEKILQAQKAGAAAVLVTNSVIAMYETGGGNAALISDVDCNSGSGWIATSDILDPPYLPEMQKRMPSECTSGCPSCSITPLTIIGRSFFLLGIQLVSGIFGNILCLYDIFLFSF